ncbi:MULTISPECIES: DUF4262 domain-containing protein [unclassified Polaromonas]|uniref:DUF4262 domain-containing protein n=1 Tax=unclassified Polaromonas TaxID=2638319 RepID=UPI000F07ED6D|nr:MULTISPECIES: DUF4262 domain-containing protein [unclassified Polaromonas]AYQ28874.1 DUF4262 domain-containing protein [Polaromonas sp. SP1]QGJ20010.1 DUF4262 domain-containing protein [Polaromonas sp. Pch-P]
MSQFIDSVRQDIARYGCSVISISDEEPPFAYTVGLWQTQRHPELIIFGLPQQVMANILNAVVTKMKNSATRELPRSHQDIGGSYGIQVMAANKAHLDRYFGFALGFYEERFPIAQIVWPDREGRFPGDPDYDKSYEDLQPILKPA